MSPSIHPLSSSHRPQKEKSIWMNEWIIVSHLLPAETLISPTCLVRDPLMVLTSLTSHNWGAERSTDSKRMMVMLSLCCSALFLLNFEENMFMCFPNKSEIHWLYLKMFISGYCRTDTSSVLWTVFSVHAAVMTFSEILILQIPHQNIIYIMCDFMISSFLLHDSDKRLSLCPFSCHSHR